MSAPKVFFYVQHLLGIGHLARASRISQALVANGFDTTIITGGMPVSGFPAENIKSVALPPVVAGSAGFSGLCDSSGNPVTPAFLEHRRDLLLAAFHACSPDIVITEAFPFGRRQMRFELLPLLEAIEAASRRPKLVASIRDVLQERTKPGRDQETVDLVKAHFDLVLVHGDPIFVTLPETFPLAAEISDKIAYTGMVAGPDPQVPAETFDIVVSAGGGAVGLELIQLALEVAKRTSSQWQWCVITGPNLPESDFAELSSSAPANVKLVRFRTDFPALLKGARLSISQAGYNTVCDLLRAGCRTIIVPFTAGGETEQALRASRLQKLGITTVLPEAGLSVDLLQAAVETSLSGPEPLYLSLDLDGANNTASLLRRLLAQS